MVRRVHRNSDGFTLLEIVVSLAILAVALPPLMQAFSHATRSEARASQRTTAFYLLRYQMESILMAGYPQETGEEDGEFGENLRYRWHSKVQDTETEGLRLLTVSIIWDAAGQERSVSVNTYVADPQMASAEESSR